METIVQILPFALYLPAAVGNGILNRTLLLTDKFKFPYPYTVTVIQVLFAAAIGLVFRLLLRCTLPSRLRHGSTSSGAPAYRRIGDHDFAPPVSPKIESGFPNGRKMSSTPPGKLVFPFSLFRTQASGRGTYPVVALLLSLRLGLANHLLSRIAFPTYTLGLAACPFFSLAASYPQLPASKWMVSLAAALILIAAALPLASPVDLGTAGLLALLPLLDTLLCWSLCSLMASMAHHEPAPSSTYPTTLRSKLVGILEYILHSVYPATVIYNTVTLLAGVFAAMFFVLSREMHEIKLNCYVLDDAQFWSRLLGGAAVLAPMLLLLILAATNTSPLTLSLLQVLLGSVLLPAFEARSISPQGWFNLAICYLWCVLRALQTFEEAKIISWKAYRASGWSFAKAAATVLLLYGAVYEGARIIPGYMSNRSHPLEAAEGSSSNAIPSTILSTAPDANSFASDAFLGERPALDTVIDIDLIMSHCYNSANESGVFDIMHCLSYLASSREEYLQSPAAASSGRRKGSGKKTSSLKDKLFSTFSSSSFSLSSSSPLQSKQGKCDGETYIFHTYWTGPATWRFELFIKGYLYTQNLACSRLWIWLDTDIDPGAMDQMLHQDSIFQRLLPLLDAGYVSLKEWAIPDRIPMPAHSDLVQAALPNNTWYRAYNTEMVIADNIVRDANGSFWLVPDKLYKTVSTPTQVSDFVRFYVLYLHGGLYLDLDVLLMQDFRPLLVPNAAREHNLQTAWAEQWVERGSPGDYNTALLSLPASSSLSAYLLHGGMRMGMNFHPMAIGRMLCGDHRNDELLMWHTAMFDPLVTNLRRKGTTLCTVPCHKNFESVFLEVVEEADREWCSYHGVAHPAHTLPVTPSSPSRFDAQGTNRTMENFFKGSFAYHVHNQWWKFPQPNSWMDVITQAQDGFFEGTRTNVYGEKWGGPSVPGYDRSRWGWS